jgi:GTPase SAR1 family protein
VKEKSLTLLLEVGKTAIIVRYIRRQFLGDYNPIIEDEHRKKIEFQGKTLILSVLDAENLGFFFIS